MTFDSQTQHTRNTMLLVFICTLGLLELFLLLWYVHQDKGDILPVSEDDNQLQKNKITLNVLTTIR